MARVLVVSDSHLSPRTPEADTNWSATLAWIADEAADADLVVHTGDISLDGAGGRTDLDHARAQLDQLPIPWLAVPGNHDIGDLNGDHGLIDDERRARYETVFGDRFWTTELGGWRLVGIDIQELLGGGTAAEQWWRWLDEQLEADRRLAVFQHRPIVPLAEGEDDKPGRYVIEPGRERLLTVYAEAGVELVVSGHVHQWRSVERDGIRHVWVPSTWATMPDSFQPLIGEKVVGLTTIDLDDHDEAALVVPDGMAQDVIGETIPFPYSD